MEDLRKQYQEMHKAFQDYCKVVRKKAPLQYYKWRIKCLPIEWIGLKFKLRAFWAKHFREC